MEGSSVDAVKPDSPGETWECIFCGKNFDDFSKYWTHKTSHNADKEYNCVKCGKKFMQAKRLQEHVKAIHTTRLIKCDKCEKTFNKNSQYLLHATTHMRDEIKRKRPSQISCDICKKIFVSLTGLNVHKGMAHVPKKPPEYRCKKCNINYNRPADLAHHNRKTHLNYHCPVCLKKFTNLSQVETHVSQKHWDIEAKVLQQNKALKKGQSAVTVDGVFVNNGQVESDDSQGFFVPYSQEVTISEGGEIQEIDTDSKDCYFYLEGVDQEILIDSVGTYLIETDDCEETLNA